MSNFTERLEKIQSSVNEERIKQAKLEERKEILKKDRSKLLEELKELGIKEEDLQEESANLEMEIEEKISGYEKELGL